MLDTILSHPQRFIALAMGLLLIAIAPHTVIAKPTVPSQSAGLGAAVPLQIQPSTARESLTLGYTVEGPATYNDVIGRILDQAAFRSFRDSDIYYIFPAAANRPTIEAARFKITKAEGTYSGGVNLTLEVLDSHSGAVQRVVAVANNGWENSQKGAWVDLSLADSGLSLETDEFLAAHFQLDGEPGGDLDIRPEFKIDLLQPLSAQSMLAKINNASSTSADIPQTADSLAQVASAPAFDPKLAVWHSGVTFEGEPNYDNLKRRLISTVAAFRSYRAVSDIYYVFPKDPAELVTVLAAKFHMLSREGAYDGNATLTFEIHANNNSTDPRTISTAAIDLTEAETGAWITVPLSDDLKNLELAPDEFLTARFNLKDGAGGSLDIRPMFEIEIAVTGNINGDWPSEGGQIYLPVVLK